MPRDLKDCEAQALQLTPKERAALAQRLIASLDALDDAENEMLWLEEAERLYQEYKKGNISARGADEVLREARSAIQ
jgi:hypothetical protein